MLKRIVIMNLGIAAKVATHYGCKKEDKPSTFNIPRLGLKM